MELSTLSTTPTTTTIFLFNNIVVIETCILWKLWKSMPKCIKCKRENCVEYLCIECIRHIASAEKQVNKENQDNENA